MRDRSAFGRRRFDIAITTIAVHFVLSGVSETFGIPLLLGGR